MRYTTVIDITETPIIYRNIHARLLYFHLALKAGWHDVDRDIVDISIRQMAAQVGLTLAATRHAITQLQKAGLLSRQGTVWVIKKWVEEQPVSSRPKTEKQRKVIEQRAEARIQEEKLQRELELERARREALAAKGKNKFMLMFENLQRKAAMGDLEAQQRVKKYQKTYEEAVQNMKEKQRQ